MAINGSNGNDTIQGTAGADVIYGKEGDDKIFGGRGDDVLFGGRGNDTLVGGLGDDILTGVGDKKGFGEMDILQGGPGADIYVLGDRKQAFYLGNGGADFADVRGFDFQEDKLRLFGSVGDYTFGSSGSNAITISFGGDIVGIIRGVNNTEDLLSATQFLGNANSSEN